MREIFVRRGKRVDNGKWVYGNIVFTRSGRAFLLEGSFFSGESHEGDFKHGEIYGTEVIPTTVGQFTGLLDKNGKKIFEGDIVLSSSNSEQAVVKWGDYSACFLLSFNGWCADFDIPYELEVIGNIYDNPELLKDDDILSKKLKEFYEKKKAITERLRKDNEDFK